MDVSVHRALENHIYGNQSNTVMDVCVCVCISESERHVIKPSVH